MNCILSHIVPFDKRDADGNFVILAYQTDSDPSKYDFPPFIKAGRTVLDAWFFENGGAKGQTIILDMRNFSLGCVMKVSISAMRNIIYFNKVTDAQGLSIKYDNFSDCFLPNQTLRIPFHPLQIRERLPNSYNNKTQRSEVRLPRTWNSFFTERSIFHLTHFLDRRSYLRQ